MLLEIWFAEFTEYTELPKILIGGSGVSGALTGRGVIYRLYRTYRTTEPTDWEGVLKCKADIKITTLTAKMF